jgi:hypothetical protein
VRLRCPVLVIQEQCDDAIRARLKRDLLWRGERLFLAWLAEHERVAVAIDVAGGEFDPAWPVRIAWLARTVLSARSRARAKAVLENGRRAVDQD